VLKVSDIASACNVENYHHYHQNMKLLVTAKNESAINRRHILPGQSKTLFTRLDGAVLGGAEMSTCNHAVSRKISDTIG
jgi:hypothetical protein